MIIIIKFQPPPHHITINMSTKKVIISAISFIIAGIIIIFGPLTIIWSLNVLFTIGIPYSLETWLSVIILYATIKGNVKIND